ncbi:MAG: prepilin-type N-terminal cleavage/methylation domain-containing protein [Desulforegulaceae bacterium]|nr:prepilin-type N-terminal cleavage/methylation domain-containing protein [Desulforegulaceae bacterium]
MLKNNESGFTLVEVLFAMALFSIGLFALSMMQAHFAKGLADSRSIVHATDIAMNKIEELSNSDSTNDDFKLTLDPNSPHKEVKKAGNRSYDLQWTVNKNNNPGLILDIEIKVSWKEGERDHFLSFPWVKGF